MSVRSTIAPLARHGIRSAARAFDRVASPPAGAVVLAYHQVGGPRAGSVNLSRSAFAEQMAMIADGRARRPVLDLDGVVDAVSGTPGDDAAVASVGSAASVAITFDDGTADFVDQALPILVDLGLPVALYLATGHVDEGRSFWGDGTVLSWAAVRDAHSTGIVTIGSHTHDHVLLDRAAPDHVATDLDRSIERIAEEVGVRPVHFAYPKALAPSPAARALVRDRFASAALAGGRANRPGATDLWALDRTPVTVADDLGDVEAKVGGGLRLEAGLRAAIDRVRYRGASR
jgi:peptidoglycan/xylan/chitin deacetylase (PgdA/CDA1 family)